MTSRSLLALPLAAVVLIAAGCADSAPAPKANNDANAKPGALPSYPGDKKQSAAPKPPEPKAFE